MVGVDPMMRDNTLIIVSELIISIIRNHMKNRAVIQNPYLALRAQPLKKKHSSPIRDRISESTINIYHLALGITYNCKCAFELAGF